MCNARCIDLTGHAKKIATTVFMGKDNKYVHLIFIINNARIGYIKMYSVYFGAADGL